MLSVTLTEKDNYVQIGNDIRIYLEPTNDPEFYRKIRVRIDAPSHVNIARRKLVERAEGRV